MIPTSMPVIFIDTAIKVLLLLVLASVLVFLCRRCSAATRHWIWSLSLGSTLALPVLSIFLPAIDLEVLARVPPILTGAGESFTVVLPPPEIPAVHAADALEASNIQADQQGLSPVFSYVWTYERGNSFIERAIVGWLIVASFFTARILFDGWRLAQLTGEANLAVGSEWLRMIESLREQAGIRAAGQCDGGSSELCTAGAGSAG
ncbi:MAG: hypothetical protein WBE26_18225 [Phycisphaerae bacterium]